MPEDPGTPVGSLSYTEASQELDEIVAFFEQREVDIDQLVDRLERATALVDELDRRLRRTRTQVEELVPRLAAAVAEEDDPVRPPVRGDQENEEAELDAADALVEEFDEALDADPEAPGLF
jgi:exodeoxyribonuclease VII small subunit